MRTYPRALFCFLACGLAGFAFLPPRAQAAPKTAPAVTQSYNTYQSWLVACDNTLTCASRGFNADLKDAEFTVERQAGPQGTFTATIRAEHPFVLADITIDGAPAELSPQAWQITTEDGVTSATTHDLTAFQPLASRLSAASEVALDEETIIPLSGFTAALLRLDERQGRINTQSALARPGSQPVSAVPPAPPVPQLPFHPITAHLAPDEATRLITRVQTTQKAFFTQEECETDIANLSPEAHALDDHTALVLIPCTMGAYQGSHVGFLVARDADSIQPLALAIPYAGDTDSDTSFATLTNATFTPTTGVLGMLSKGRGLADCGLSAEWIWNGQTFVLSALTYQEACGGVRPEDWPVLFRSAQ